MNLGNSARFFRVLPATTGAPGSTSLQGTVVLDMQGWDAVCWVAILENSTASSTGVGKLYHMHSDSTSTTDMVSCTGAGYIAETSTGLLDRLLVLDVQKPLKRYVSAYAYFDAANRPEIIGIQYKGRECPVTQDTTAVLEAVVAVSPTT